MVLWLPKGVHLLCLFEPVDQEAPHSLTLNKNSNELMGSVNTVVKGGIYRRGRKSQTISYQMHDFEQDA